jgi:hypothetical protein
MTGILRTAAVVLACPAVALLWRPTSVAAQTSLLEVEKGSVKLMQVNDDGGLVVRASESPGPIPASGSGYRLMWYPRKYAFRVGLANGTEWDDANIGSGSIAMGDGTTASGLKSTAMGAETVANNLAATAMGSSTTASGSSSTAMGLSTTAVGSSSTAMGRDTKAIGDFSTAMGVGTTAGDVGSTAMGSGTTASGPYSTAMGRQTKAIGNESTAMGLLTVASGDLATAMGYQTQAAGDRSTALGSNARALGEGSFVYGDASTTAILAAAANMFAVRASGGFRFRTSGDESTGCNLQGGTGTWNCTSSRLAKEGFEDLDGESVLAELAAMQIQRWRYRNTGDWHVGPTAEDFHAAFQLGPGPTTISTVDADGISLLAVQALERRTAELREENADLRRRLEALEAERAAERK